MSSLSHIFHTDAKSPCFLCLVLKGRLGYKKLQWGQKIYFPPIGLIGFWRQQGQGATVAACWAQEGEWRPSRSPSVSAPPEAGLGQWREDSSPPWASVGGKLEEVIWVSDHWEPSFELPSQIHRPLGPWLERATWVENRYWELFFSGSCVSRNNCLGKSPRISKGPSFMPVWKLLVHPVPRRFCDWKDWIYVKSSYWD